MQELRTYEDQVKDAADAAGVELKDAFVKAGFCTSRYYRMLGGSRLTQASAQKIITTLKGKSG